MYKRTASLIMAFCLTASAAAKATSENVGLQAVLQSTNQFSSSFFQTVVEKEQDNLITSPLSAAMVLSMAAYGARGETEQQMKNVLHLPSDNGLAQSGFQSLIDNLNSIDNVEFRLANKVFPAQSFDIKPTFLELTQSYFRSTAQSVDYGKPNEAAQTINTWVEDQTNKRIKDIVNPDDLNEATTLVLVNAVYFKGQWKHKFDASETQERPFHVDANTVKNVPTMYRKGSWVYGRLQELDAQFIQLPYKNEDLSMLIFLPNKVDGLSELERKLQHQDVTNILKQGHEHEVHLYLPKFKIETTLDLEEVLRKMGMGLMFSDMADFTGIANANLKVSKVVQKAFIEVNEEGSEAAAATGLSVRPLSSFWSPPKPIEFHVNRPFLAIVKYGDVVLFLANAKS